MRKILLLEIAVSLMAILLVIAISYWAFRTDKFLPKASTNEIQKK